MPKSRNRKKKRRTVQRKENKPPKNLSVKQMNNLKADLDLLSRIKKIDEYQTLKFICKTFHDVYEEYILYSNGTCYLQGYCLTEILKRLSYQARCVTGKQALLIKNSNKYAMYGSLNKQGLVIGNFHTWTEVEINNAQIIVDTSTQDNIQFLKSHGLEIDSNISGEIITNNGDNSLYKYKEDNKLKSLSQHFLKRVEYKLIEDIIHETCVRVYC